MKYCSCKLLGPFISRLLVVDINFGLDRVLGVFGIKLISNSRVGNLMGFLVYFIVMSST